MLRLSLETTDTAPPCLHTPVCCLRPTDSARRFFECLDKNGSGDVTMNEFMQGLERLARGKVEVAPPQNSAAFVAGSADPFADGADSDADSSDPELSGFGSTQASATHTTVVNPAFANVDDSDSDDDEIDC